MLFTFYSRRLTDNRAPSVIKLEDYEEIGQLESHSRNNATTVFYKSENQNQLSKPSPIKIGDIIKDGNNNFFILTPLFQWSICEVISIKTIK